MGRESDMNHSNTGLPHQHRIWILVGMVGLVALGWSNILDQISTAYIDHAFLGAGAIYATARGINALVSVLQGTEIDLWLATFTVGELLDPLNDLIERFSSVMMFALGSLALQKILLEFVSHSTFNILLTVLGAGAIASSFIGTPRQYHFLSRLFLVTAMIRFSLAIVVLANGWVDHIFLEKNDERRHQRMSEYHAELAQVSSLAGIQTNTPSKLEIIEKRLRDNHAAIQDEQREISLARTRLEAAQARLKDLDKRSWWERLQGETTLEIEKLEAKIETEKRNVENHEIILKSLETTRRNLERILACLYDNNNGAKCMPANTDRSGLNVSEIKMAIESLFQRLDDFASNAINLLMSLILKSILLPILFLYFLVRAARAIIH